MPYVVTDACIKDFRCVDECATGAIAPGVYDAKAAEVSQVFIDPDTCIDCGVCATVCETNAIYSSDELPADKAEFSEKNAGFFK